MADLSANKRLQIANCMYANVSGYFAIFSNEKYRGPNFKWEEFPEMMEQQSDLWWKLYNYNFNKSKHKQQELDAAKKFAREIAETLIERMKCPY